MKTYKISFRNRHGEECRTKVQAYNRAEARTKILKAFRHYPRRKIEDISAAISD